jgi:hypothetical protein
VRSAYRPNFKDKARKPLETMAARLAVKHACKKDPKLQVDKDLHDVETNTKLRTKKIKRIIKSKEGKVLKEIIEEKLVDENGNIVSDATAAKIQAAQKDPVRVNQEKLDPEHPKDPDAFVAATTMIPPHDLFGNFKRYREDNYEQLLDAVNQLYCERPDIDFAINPHSWHDTKEQAESFKKQHADEVITEVFTAESGKWNICAPYQKMRDTVNFYNKNTIILEEMMKQLERDERLGQDLMNKRVEKEKKKNVIEAGPDDANFKKWVGENNELNKLGAKYLGDMASEDTPENAVEVDVWKIAKGGLELTREKFHTQAEAPTFIQEAAAAAKAGVLPQQAAQK